MVWIGWFRCEKFQCNFLAQTFALVRPVLHRILYGNQTVPNAPKCCEILQNMNLGSNGVDRVLLLRKIPMQLHRRNFCPSSACFAPSFVRQPNGSKCNQMVQNSAKHEFRVQWGGSGAFVAKNSDATSWHEVSHKFGPFCTEFRKATKRSQMQPNGTKQRKHEFRNQWGGSGAFVAKNSNATSWHK